MNQHNHHVSKEHHGSLKSYVTGFVLSIVLTLIPLWLVMNHVLAGSALVITIMLLAVAQLIVQLFFFMHIREGEKPRYNVQALILGAVIVFTVVAGSMWIMSFNSQVQ